MDDDQADVLRTQLTLIATVKNIKIRRLRKQLEMRCKELSQANNSYMDAVKICKDNESALADSKKNMHTSLMSQHSNARKFNKLISAEKKLLVSLNKSIFSRSQLNNVLQKSELEHSKAKEKCKKEELGIEKINLFRDVILNE